MQSQESAPKGVSILEERIKRINLEAIANATTSEELRIALNEAITALNKFQVNLAFEEMQNEAKQLLTDPENENLMYSLNSKLTSAAKIDRVKTGQYLQLSVHYNDMEAADGVRLYLTQEFQPKSMSESLLIDMVTNAYFAHMRASHQLQALLQDGGHVSQNYENKHWIATLKELVKLVDSTNRHFTTALSALRGIRQPAINIKVQTNETFIAQNQQINKTA